jgi:O-antigen/teichoic acid export membrane protein
MAEVEDTGSQELRISRLSDTRTIALSTIWNLVGRAGPIWIALLVTPSLVHDLGVSRWGIFTIALSLVGIFGIFDFGIGRALTRSISERIGAGDEHSAASLVVTGMLALAAMGIVGGALAAVGAHFWVYHGLHIGAAERREVLYAFYALAFSAPFVILTAAMWGVIAAYQKFRAANLIGVPVQSLYYIGPLVILQFWDSLVGVMLVLVLCRVISSGIYWWLCRRIMPSLAGARPDLRALAPVLKLGGWMTVSNIAWPILMYADRFIIASVLTAASTAYYTTPFDVVSRLSIIPVAIMSSAYPAMAMSFRGNQSHTAMLLRHSMLAIATILLPGCLILVSFRSELMTLWLGAGFATHSAPLLAWLSIGILVTSVDAVAAGLIDAIGRPDLNAKLSLLELVISIPVLLAMLSWLGLEGAAIAWVFRCSLDCCIRLFIAVHCYRPIKPAILQALPALIAAVGLLLLLVPLRGLSLRIGLDIAAFAIYLAVVLRLSITKEERKWIMATLTRFLVRCGLKTLHPTESL